MILYLVRHGIAEDIAPQGGDPERRLTQQGTLRTAMVAKGLKRLGVEFGCVVSSPYARARQTAEIIARVVNYSGEIHLDKRLVPMTRFDDACDLIREFGEYDSLLLAGHQPSMGEIIGGIVAGGALIMEVKKASVTAIQVERMRPAVRGTLLWTLPPKVFEGLTK